WWGALSGLAPLRGGVRSRVAEAEGETDREAGGRRPPRSRGASSIPPHPCPPPPSYPLPLHGSHALGFGSHVPLPPRGRRSASGVGGRLQPRNGDCGTSRTSEMIRMCQRHLTMMTASSMLPNQRAPWLQRKRGRGGKFKWGAGTEFQGWGCVAASAEDKGKFTRQNIKISDTALDGTLDWTNHCSGHDFMDCHILVCGFLDSAIPGPCCWL
ncbi:unnamed protein product, partial [Urochloa humidicola]